MARYATYLRASTDDQETTHQHDAIDEWLSEHDIDHSTVDRFVDLAQSGADPGREQFTDLVETIGTDGYENVIVWEILRLARLGSIYQRFFEECEDAGTTVVITDGWVEEVRPDGTGKLIADISAAVVEEERRRLIESIAERRQAHDNPTVVVGGGDEIAPHALGPLSQWCAPVDVLNLIDPDAEGVGNHDLDYGLSGFANASDASEFPWLVANLENATTGEPIDGAEPYTIVERDGVRVGFVGLVDPAIRNKTNLAFGENGSRITDFREVGSETAEMLEEEENIDVVVALAHIGVPESKELARADNGSIDAIVTGDDEVYYPPQETSGTMITEASSTSPLKTVKSPGRTAESSTSPTQRRRTRPPRGSSPNTAPKRASTRRSL